jgi:hypothetical protein
VQVKFADGVIVSVRDDYMEWHLQRAVVHQYGSSEGAQVKSAIKSCSVAFVIRGDGITHLQSLSGFLLGTERWGASLHLPATEGPQAD